MPEYSHLHNHTQYSLLDGASNIDKMMTKAIADKQKAVAITDHGNMFGVFQFVSTAHKKGIIPIVGCEFYLCDNHFDKSDSTRYHQLLLAKDEVGYKNLMKLSSLGFMEGFYFKPRIDKAVLLQHKDGLIASTCCLAGIVPRTILRKDETEAEKEFRWWVDNFGDDYYIELQRHGIEDQDKVNEVLVRWAKKYNVKMIATNDTHYVEDSDSEAQDILLCIQTGKDYNDPNRMRFQGHEFYFKTQNEMNELFADLPIALDNTLEVVSKITNLKLERDILLPAYTVPEKFPDQQSYLAHLTFEGAKKRYGEINEEVRSRLEYELKVIQNMKFAGYFLIVQDFITAAKDLGVAVGPGRGSAAGSAVAYCIGITNIDPIKYRLLFERFLNPERVSMPDMDIDFDDNGRQRVIDYVVQKYGRNQVAQIITFGTMAPKMAVKDVSRALGVPLIEANAIAKLIPENPGMTFARAYEMNKDLVLMKEKASPLILKTLRVAETLEGCSRHTGVHAAGIIIAPSDIREYIPVSKNKDSDLFVTQYSGKYIESAGMLKMDFLGLKTLSILKDAIRFIKQNHGVEIDLDKIPLDDAKTLELFQRGEMTGVFQFESKGMREYLKLLKPTNIEDLIAMNALYRPGPMGNIPEYIARKHGRSPVVYPHAMIKDILEPTFGIMVYQEQIMQVAQKMANYTLGSADLLRKAMGKKNAAEMQKHRAIFSEGAMKNGTTEQEASDIYDTMEKFAEYGFNRSHSVAYAVIAFQTSYLKAHYPAEFMASALTHNMTSVEEMQKFLSDCKRLGIKTLGPDINESEEVFSVKNGAIRFALTAVKGVGEAAVNSLMEERNTNGPFKGIFDLAKRIGGKGVNKKLLEALIYAGGFDCFTNVHRAQYFATPTGEKVNMIEKAFKYASGNTNGKKTTGSSLFGDIVHDAPKEPEFPQVEHLNQFEKLHKEKEVTGIFLSGHPLEDYMREVEKFRTCPINQIDNFRNQDVTLIGLITEVNHRTAQNGNPFGSFKLEDFESEMTVTVFGKTYIETNKYFQHPDMMVMVRGKYTERRGMQDQYEFYVNSIELLSDVRSKYVKKLVMKVELETINDAFIKKIMAIQHNYKGNVPLYLQVYDVIDEIKLNFISKELYVSYDESFLKYINDIKEAELGLN